jgi:hypothetical protein
MLDLEWGLRIDGGDHQVRRHVFNDQINECLNLRRVDVLPVSCMRP